MCRYLPHGLITVVTVGRNQVKTILSALADIPVMPITAYVINLDALPFPESLSPTFDAMSLSSFLFMWIATALILSQYRYKMGKIKYFTLMALPLVYYIFPFQNYFGDTFFTLLHFRSFHSSCWIFVFYLWTGQ